MAALYTLTTLLGSGLVLCLLWQEVSTAQTSCTASAAVEGYPATITCNFAEDLSHRKLYLNVLRYDFDGQHYVPDLMAGCYWENFNSPVPTCTTINDGVRLEGKIGRHATIVIDKVTARHAGVYLCNHALADSHEIKTCYHHVRGNMTSCRDVTVYEEDSTSLTCNFNSDLSKTHDAFSIIWFPNTDGQSKTMEYETVVSCNWFGPGDGDWHCTGHGLFSFTNDNITDSFRLDITQATLRHSGHFVCSIVQATSQIQAKRCSLTVQRKPPYITTPTPTSITTTSTTTSSTTTKPGGAPSTTEGASSGVVFFNSEPRVTSIKLRVLVLGFVTLHFLYYGPLNLIGFRG